MVYKGTDLGVDVMSETMSSITIDLGRELALSCGCKTNVGNILALGGLQHLQGQPITCPLHRCEHQFSRDTDFIEIAVIVSQYYREASGLATARVVEFRVGDEVMELVMSHSIPRFATLIKLTISNPPNDSS